MAWYAYKKVRELIPKYLEDKYRNNSADPESWFWDTDYDGDLFDAAAEYIELLQKQVADLQTELKGVVQWH